MQTPHIIIQYVLMRSLILYISDSNSALFIILNGTKEEHLDMLDGGIIQRLLEEKWKTFARVCIKPHLLGVNHSVFHSLQ